MSLLTQTDSITFNNVKFRAELGTLTLNQSDFIFSASKNISLPLFKVKNHFRFSEKENQLSHCVVFMNRKQNEKKIIFSFNNSNDLQKWGKFLDFFFLKATAPMPKKALKKVKKEQICYKNDETLKNELKFDQISGKLKVLLEKGENKQRIFNLVGNNIFSEIEFLEYLVREEEIKTKIINRKPVETVIVKEEISDLYNESINDFVEKKHFVFVEFPLIWEMFLDFVVLSKIIDENKFWEDFFKSNLFNEKNQNPTEEQKRAFKENSNKDNFFSSQRIKTFQASEKTEPKVRNSIDFRLNYHLKQTYRPEKIKINDVKEKSIFKAIQNKLLRINKSSIMYLNALSPPKTELTLEQKADQNHNKKQSEIPTEKLSKSTKKQHKNQTKILIRNKISPKNPKINKNSPKKDKNGIKNKNYRIIDLVSKKKLPEIVRNSVLNQNFREQFLCKFYVPIIDLLSAFWSLFRRKENFEILKGKIKAKRICNRLKFYYNGLKKYEIGLEKSSKKGLEALFEVFSSLKVPIEKALDKFDLEFGNLTK